MPLCDGTTDPVACWAPERMLVAVNGIDETKASLCTKLPPLCNTSSRTAMTQHEEPELKNTVSTSKFSFENALDYHDRRFGRRTRMQRLDRLEKNFAEDVFKLLPDKPVVLDAPCGNGRFFPIFSRASQYRMADYSENMLEACRQLHQPGPNVELIRADIAAIPLPDQSADLCFCMRLFQHMKSDEVRSAALAELARISKRYVALSFYNAHCLRYYYRKALRKKIRGNYISYAHLCDLASEVGLTPVRRTPSVNVLEQQCLVVFEKGRSPE